MVPKIAVIGDLLLDRYDFCENRSNPESSAPCYRVHRTKFLPGGAGNVAANLVSLGASTTLFGIVGEDEQGKILAGEISRLGINQRIYFDGSIKTIVKQRVISLADGRYHARLDFGDSQSEIEMIKKLNGKVLETISAGFEDDNFDAFVVSDYNKGLITPELMALLEKCNKKIYVDPKQDFSLYRGVELIKPNRTELLTYVGAGDERKKALDLASWLETDVLLTLGSDGMFFAGKSGESFYLPAHKTEVVDVTGCGDTALASLVFYRTIGYSIREAVKLANRAAGISVQHSGCHHISRKDLENF